MADNKTASVPDCDYGRRCRAQQFATELASAYEEIDRLRADVKHMQVMGGYVVIPDEVRPGSRRPGTNRADRGGVMSEDTTTAYPMDLRCWHLLPVIGGTFVGCQRPTGHEGPHSHVDGLFEAYMTPSSTAPTEEADRDG